jgi:hypothetical protein
MEHWWSELIVRLRVELWDDDDEDDAFAQMLLLQSTIELDACVHDYSGSRPCCRVNIERDNKVGEERFWCDYFV